MSLANVLYPPPTKTGWEEWAFAHYQHHQGIIYAARVKNNIDLEQLAIYPLNFHDLQNWLQQHQQMHDQMNAASGSQGNDLSSVDFSNTRQRDAWLFINFIEHKAVALNLGVPI